MECTNYESPTFKFQSLKLMERVADTCWGYHYGWFDPDGDGPLPSERIDLTTFGSCKSVEDGLVQYINEKYNGYLNKPINGNDVKTNTKSTIVSPRES